MTKTRRTLATLELVGGDLSLNLANSVNMRPIAQHDYLDSYASLVAWGEKVGALSAQQSQQLGAIALEQADRAETVLAKAHQLRDTVYRVFSRIAAHSQPEPSDLRYLQQASARAQLKATLLHDTMTYRLDWHESSDLEAAIWPLAYAATNLLLSDQRGRIKECPSCGWLFLDTSKSGQRRWCSMNACGARDKMQRYLQRQRDPQESN